jgi:acyl-coenzyme A thioesterase PaaI-like protein
LNDGIEEPRAPAHFDGVVRDDGWTDWNLKDNTRFNGFIEPLAVRREANTPDGRPQARVRMHPAHKHSNLGNAVHGAVTLALIDVGLFAAAHQFGSLNAGFSVTLDLNSQFVGGGRIDEPMDAIVELVRETGRLVFLRGMVVQGDGDSHIVAAFSGTIRKAAQDKR